MNSKGTRKTNGEGCIYTTIAKQKRKKFLNHECSICSECTNKCNRAAFEKCDKCRNCKTDCLKYCDRYYCTERVQAQITINGRQTTVANEKKRKDAVSKKIEAEAKAQTKNYIQKSGIKLIDVCRKVQDEKFDANKICANTKDTDRYHFKHIESWPGFDKPVQKVTYQDINEFLNSITYLSQSEIGKIAAKIKAGLNKCIIDKIIAYSDNPMPKVTIPISDKSTKKVEAFEVEEQRKLMNYIQNNPLIASPKCKYDEETIKNLIICLLLSGTRIGELGALDYDTRIDLDEKRFIINRSLTREDGKVIMGKTTKTGRKKIQVGEVDERYVPLDIFDEELMINTIKSQIKIAKANPKNKEHLLFCDKNGNYISHTSLDNIFKRICREAKVKLNLVKGCFLHMCRHTAATRMLEAGMDIFVIAQILGHSDITQLKKRYAHTLMTYVNKQLKNSQAYYAEELKAS